MIRVRIGSEEHDLGWEEWEERVRHGRVPDDALVQFEAVTGSEWVPARDLELYRSLRNDAALAWQGDFLRGPPPLMTALLVGVQIRVWWLARIPEVRGELVERFTNFASPTLENGEVWRPLTMGFLHTDPFHLVLNMLWLAYTGWNIERALGRANLVTIYVAAVLGGSLLSMFGSPQTPSLGASGGVFGLVAASTLFGFVRPDLLPRRGRRLFGAAMLPYLLLMFWSGLMNEDTDNWSHFGGLVVGAVLALLLDPEPLQRRTGWNRRFHVGVGLATVAILATLWGLGPRALPLLDADRARELASRAPTLGRGDDSPRALSWSVPAGWRPAVDLIGTPTFASRAGTRSWGVKAREARTLRSVEALADDFVATLRKDWPDLVVSDAEPTTFGGHPGLTLRALPSPDQGIVLQWFGVARGVHALEATWVVERDHEDTLQPLLERLAGRVVWGAPTDLEEARAEVAFAPRSTGARADLAQALARIGETDEALALHRELIDAAPNDPDRWEALFDTLALGGVDAAARRRWLEEAVTAAPTPRVIDAVVDQLEADGDTDQALGLLDLAWRQRPGDRRLRRSRRTRQLSVHLTAEGQPYDDVVLPGTSTPRPAADRAARSALPLTLAAATEAGRQRRAETDTAAAIACEALRAGDVEASWTALLWFFDGGLPAPDDDTPEALLASLARPGRDPWLPEAVAACLPEDPSVALPTTRVPRRG